jgi:ABC-type transporter Mla subunit MlaD
MASLKDVERVADDLSSLVDQLRQELRESPSFDKLVQLTDQISEHADEAAGTFSTINEVLMNRLTELKDGASSAGSSSSSRSGSSRAKATT